MPGIPASDMVAEEDVTSLGLPQVTSTQSTDHLLAPYDTLTGSESVASLATITTGNLSNFNLRTDSPDLEPVVVQLVLAQGKDNRAGPPRSSAKTQVGSGSDSWTFWGALKSGVGLQDLTSPYLGDTRDAVTGISPEIQDPQRKPEYKSLPLRWPYQAFMFVFIAGIFAFLEYEIHNLPPQHFAVLQINLPKPSSSPSLSTVKDLIQITSAEEAMTNRDFQSSPATVITKYQVSDVSPLDNTSHKSSTLLPTAVARPLSQPTPAETNGSTGPSIVLPGPVPPEPEARSLNLRTESDYLLAVLGPVLLKTLLSIAVQVFVSRLNAMLPFRALSHGRGATAEISLFLSRSSCLLTLPLTSARFLHQRPLPPPAPRPAAAVRLPPHRRVDGPGAAPRRSRAPLPESGAAMRAAEGLLGLLAALVVTVGVLLARWRTSVEAEPWSIANIAALVAHDRNGGGHLSRIVRSIAPRDHDGGADDGDQYHVRDVAEVERDVVREGRRFRLGFFSLPADEIAANADDERLHQGHGIIVVDGDAVATAADDTESIRSTARDSPRLTEMLGRVVLGAEMEHVPQVLALMLLAGLPVLVLYYENATLETAFQAFMNGQSFGVRILFTAFGTAVSAFWDYYFGRADTRTNKVVSELQIHRRLAASNNNNTAQPARTSILLSPPSDVFVGLWHQGVSGIRTRQDALYLATAVAALLAKFMPTLLSNIPFRNTVTWKMHETCTWLAVGVLGYMVAVLLAALWVKRCARTAGGVHMPVRADTLLGCMYYLCESDMVGDFEGLAAVPLWERDALVSKMGKRYVCGYVGVGHARFRRVKVDYYCATREKSEGNLAEKAL
ncbi:hypothetical protein B0T26DRAFT_780294 [Lasiosphaeria miniovina]|uniref:Uncharacterized protein n=1 Tax=Lasiosphaeria miniovina TaxID=1954250 RepID=A0AA40DTG0_9PEZI|nr:uncharacterized protein B0T26DRAFT_780294 [Lasiosphaeria miniovina]KAK0712717.1 hypothetical protein B0T26DRAFT_780294 [Lasiosphaeria miniovina]